MAHVEKRPEISRAIFDHMDQLVKLIAEDVKKAYAVGESTEREKVAREPAVTRPTLEEQEKCVGEHCTCEVSDGANRYTACCGDRKGTGRIAAADSLRVLREAIVPALKRCVKTSWLSPDASFGSESDTAKSLLLALGIPADAP